jgi:hypothetical protein
LPYTYLAVGSQMNQNYVIARAPMGFETR